MVVAIACVRRLWRRTPPWARRRHAAPAAPRRHRRGRRERWCRRRGCGDQLSLWWWESLLFEGKISENSAIDEGFAIASLDWMGFKWVRGKTFWKLFPGKHTNFLWIFQQFLVQFPHCACCLARWKALGREAKTCSDLLGGDRHWRPHEGVVIVQLQPRWGNLGQG